MSIEIKKNGIRKRKQRYKCLSCKYEWGGNTTRKSDWVTEAYQKYTLKRQTLKDLSETYGKSRKTIRKYFDQYFPVTGEIKVPDEAVNLILDATFFKRREGVLVVRANKRNLMWKEIETESVHVYEELLNDFEASGAKFLSCTIDGRRGIRELIQRKFPSLPIQLCQFHQVQIVTRYLSKRPKLPAGKELRSFTLMLVKTNRKDFTEKLERWHEKWKDFLKEKTVNVMTHRWSYTHRRIRSAYRSLKTNLPWIFTFQDFPELHIPNTTNSCDGSFAHWKNKMRIHRGMASERKRKMLHFFLENT